MKKIASFEAACKALKLDFKKCLPDVSTFPKEHQKALTAHAKLIIIAQAINDGWKPDWENDNQWKYYPWLWLSSGSGLSYRVYVLQYSFSSVGSRLCYCSSEAAEYAGKKFIGLYTDYFVIS